MRKISTAVNPNLNMGAFARQVILLKLSQRNFTNADGLTEKPQCVERCSGHLNSILKILRCQRLSELPRLMEGKILKEN